MGAAKQLRQLVNGPTSQQRVCASALFSDWHFNPPGAPHFGGLWEAAVRSAKRLLFRTMGPHNFTYEEFITVLCRIEAVLNSRPLTTPASSDPHDLECLTPGHFLIGHALLAVPTRVTIDIGRSCISRWKLLDQCHQAFWHRWSTEYLHTLQERSKWTARKSNVSVNDMVVIGGGGSARGRPRILNDIARVKRHFRPRVPAVTNLSFTEFVWRRA